MATIHPLSPDVAAKIKSSVTISSLSTVALGLLENSIDASARKVDIHVDFARGTCSTEDDGEGITPMDFQEGGGLAKQYREFDIQFEEIVLMLPDTSKVAIESDHPDRHGSFLFSVASLSLLTIVSHHHKYNSTNAITFHHSRPAARLLPAPMHMGLANRGHGTRVIVQNLFGNMPVRVKQRPIGEEGRKARERQWRVLRRSVIGVLLARAEPLALTIRGEDSDQVFRIKFAITKEELLRNPLALAKPRSSFDVDAIRSILSQSGYVDAEDLSSLVKTSARTLAITVRALFSINPAPSRDVQFLSIGSQNITADHGFNILFDEINGMFARSSFGIREEPMIVKDNESGRDSPTNQQTISKKQLKGSGKGIDRWPIFYIRIELNPGSKMERQTLELSEQAQLSNIINVLAAMISSFLTENGFRLHKQRRSKYSTGPGIAAKEPEPINQGLMTSRSSKDKLFNHKFWTKDSSSNEIDDLGPSVVFPHRPKQSGIEKESKYFNGWGRIKYGTERKSMKQRTLEEKQAAESTQTELIQTSGQTGYELRKEGTDNRRIGSEPPSTEVGLTSEYGMNSDNTRPDATLVWKHPVSKEHVIINSRTGFVVDPDRAKQGVCRASSTTGLDPARLRQLRLQLDLASRSNDNAIGSRSWADCLLANWKNPVFATSEDRILRVDPQDLSLMQLRDNPGNLQLEFDNRFNFSLAQSRLTKSDLKRSEIIAQVDSKFILAKVDLQEGGPQNTQHRLLVLIDQHAADERIRVESLLADFVAYSSNEGDPDSDSRGIATLKLPKPITFDLASREQELFLTYKKYFASWGVHFNLRIKQGPPLSGNDLTKWSADVTDLPPVIAERCRVEPKLIIDILRDEVWKRVSNSSSQKPRGPEPEANEQSETSWIRRLQDCPQGILDMINSRACRSAIMFNDELSPVECGELVQKLSECVLPFQCAHGRPSMIPLVNLGGFDTASERVPELNKLSDFAECWGAWDPPK